MMKKAAVVLMALGGILVFSGIFGFAYSKKETYKLTEKQIEQEVQSAPPFSGGDEIYAKAVRNIRDQSRQAGFILTGTGLGVLIAGFGLLKSVRHGNGAASSSKMF